MNYRHAFHAGNHADVFKHVVLLLCLERLKTKPAPFCVLDTHGGPGLYDLTGEAAARSPEWQGGILKLWRSGDHHPAIEALLDEVRSFNPDEALTIYPGSPLLIRRALRTQDRLIVCELHPDDAQTLKRRFRDDRHVHVHQRDAFEAIGALTPFKERRGLILIDPPYEKDEEVARSVEAIRAIVERFRQACIAWWRPVKPTLPLESADAELRALGLETARIDCAVADPFSSTRLVASSMLLLNPPFGVADDAAAAAAELREKLALAL
jgi:23S rRNA (adenine2030-N6)-methyltransferase